MKKMEDRQVEVGYCDFCGDESEHLDRCAVCKREMCNKDGGTAHSAYSVEIRRHSDSEHLVGYGSKICKDCAGKKFKGTIREFFDGMIDNRKTPVAVC